MIGNYSPTNNSQMCDQNQVTSSLDSSMQPLSPMDHQSQMHSPAPNRMPEMPNNIVVDPMDVSLMQQQQTQAPPSAQQPNMVDTMNQYRRTNGSDANGEMFRNMQTNANNNFSMQSHQQNDQMCGNFNGHDMQMNDFSNGMMRKMKIDDGNVASASPMTHHAQTQPQFMMSGTGPNESAAVNGYGMSLKQEPDVSF